MFLGILWHVCVSTYTDMYGVYNVPYQHQIRPVLAHIQLTVSEKKNPRHGQEVNFSRTQGNCTEILVCRLICYWDMFIKRASRVHQLCELI